MKYLRFTWDQKKDRINRRKHGVSFKEAKTVFFNENAIESFDPDHSQSEDRFILLGASFYFRVLVVCYCYQENESVVRVISARKATRKEKEHYLGKRQ